MSNMDLIAINLFIFFLLISFLLTVAILLISAPAFKVFNLSFFVPKSLVPKINQKHIEVCLSIFIEEMSKFFDTQKMWLHLRSVRVVLAETKIYYGHEKYNGLTYSPTKIAVACDKDFQVDDQVQIWRTAFLYELLNAFIWQFDSYYVAYAESFLDPFDSSKWQFFVDATGDQHVNEQDVLHSKVNEQDIMVFKNQRKKYDELFAVLNQKVIDKFKNKN